MTFVCESKPYSTIPSFFAVLILITFNFSVSAAGQDPSITELMLDDAYKIRSSNPPKSKELLKKIERDQLSLAQQDRYDFIQAYSLFINGKVNESIVAFKDLAENGTSANERFIANASLVNLYAGTQNWSEGFKALEFIEENIQSVDSIDAQEQAHMGAINFYNLIDESEILVEYAKPLLNGQYSLRFTCSASLQWLGAAK